MELDLDQPIRTMLLLHPIMLLEWVVVPWVLPPGRILVQPDQPQQPLALLPILNSAKLRLDILQEEEEVWVSLQEDREN